VRPLIRLDQQEFDRQTALLRRHMSKEFQRSVWLIPLWTQQTIDIIAELARSRPRDEFVFRCADRQEAARVLDSCGSLRNITTRDSATVLSMRRSRIPSAMWPSGILCPVVPQGRERVLLEAVEMACPIIVQATKEIRRTLDATCAVLLELNTGTAAVRSCEMAMNDVLSLSSSVIDSLVRAAYERVSLLHGEPAYRESVSNLLMLRRVGNDQ